MSPKAKPRIHPEDNPHLPRPFKKWYNVKMANSCLTNALKKIPPEMRERLERWLTRDDLLQESFFCMWKASSSYDPERGELSTLLYTSVRNHLYRISCESSFVRIPTHYGWRSADFLEQARASDRIISQETFAGGSGIQLADVLVVHDEGAKEIEDRDAYGEILKRIKKMIPEDQHILREYYLRGRLHREIALDLGVTPQCVAKRRSEAIVKLRETFGLYSEE